MSRLRRSLHIAAEAADLLIRLRDKPRLLDLLALGVKAADIGFRVRDEFRLHVTDQPWSYFQRAGEWRTVPEVFLQLVSAGLTDVQQVTRATDNASAVVWLGRFGGARVGWVASGDPKAAAIWMKVWAADVERFTKHLSEAFWSSQGAQQVRVTPTGVEPDLLATGMSKRILETPLVHALRERVTAFSEDEHRSYLVVGPPGSGKTVAARVVAEARGARTLRVLPSAIAASGSNRPTEEATPADLLLRVLRPDVLILDDLDRLDPQQQGYALEFLDIGRRCARVVIGTVNHLELLIPAVARPERFDDHILVPVLPPALVVEITGEADPVLVAELTTWPITYVCEYAHRKRRLGEAQARAELPGLRQRVAAGGTPPRAGSARPANGALPVGDSAAVTLG